MNQPSGSDALDCPRTCLICLNNDDNLAAHPLLAHLQLLLRRVICSIFFHPVIHCSPNAYVEIPLADLRISFADLAIEDTPECCPLPSPSNSPRRTRYQPSSASDRLAISPRSFASCSSCNSSIQSPENVGTLLVAYQLCLGHLGSESCMVGKSPCQLS